MSQIEDISGYSRIRCHREDVAEVAVEPDVEKVPDREKDLGRKALPSGIHSRRGQAVEVESQDLTAESRYNYSYFQLLSLIFYVEIQLLTKSLPAVIFSFRNKGVFVRKYALFL